MGSSIDLTLGCSARAHNSDSSCYNLSINDQMQAAGNSGDHLVSVRTAEEQLRSLEEERRKLDGFKRELPSCIQLLENAIQALKKQLANLSDMPTLHLFTQNSTNSTEGCLEYDAEAEGEDMEHGERKWGAQILLPCKERSFVPFLRENPDAAAAAPSVSRPTPTMACTGVGLSLSFGEPMTSTNSSKAASDSAAGSVDVGIQTPDAQMRKDHVGVACHGVAAGARKGNPSKRKPRRCWSPELHRRFIRALHQLGGAEIATPKQICELMKVDVLTNDEVKSHLQKYRLHTRRSSPSPQPAADSQSPQLVVLGSIWVPPPKYDTLSTSQPAPGVYDSSTGQCPAQPAQFYPASALPQGQYFACISNGTSGSGPVQIHHQPILESPQAAAQSRTSLQGSVPVASQVSEATQGPNSEVYRCKTGEEEEEEAKSDSTSWKNEDYQGDVVQQ